MLPRGRACAGPSGAGKPEQLLRVRCLCHILGRPITAVAIEPVLGGDRWDVDAVYTEVDARLKLEWPDEGGSHEAHRKRAACRADRR